MSGRNWDKARLRSAMSKHGSETMSGGFPSSQPGILKRPMRAMSKEELRREADALLKSSSVTITRSREAGHYAKPPATKKPPKRGRRAPKDSGGHVRYADVAVPAGLVVYADGACEPNPGAGGWGFVVYRDGQEIHSACGGDDDATNNTMELTAALRALQWLTQNVVREPVRLLTDSTYVVDGCNSWRHGWKRKGWKRGPDKPLANPELWQALDAALIAFPLKLEWVKGHCGIIGNERADELSLIGRASAIDDARRPTPLDLIREQLDYSARA